MRVSLILLVAIACAAQKTADQRVRAHVQKAVAGVLKGQRKSAAPGKKHAMDAANQAELAKLAMVLDCVEERIETHNRLQPSAPWADISDIRRQVGGNPPKNKTLGNCPAVLRQLKSFFPTGR